MHAGRRTDSIMKGAVLGVILHDVCEEIRLEELRQILGAKRVEPSFKHATPDYVRFEKPPVVEQLEPVVLSNGEKLKPQIKYYDYGVISVLLELEFEADWSGSGATGGALGTESRAGEAGAADHSRAAGKDFAGDRASLFRMAERRLLHFPVDRRAGESARESTC